MECKKEDDPTMEKIVLYGIGTIGCGWAANFAWKGKEVTMLGRSQESLEKARLRVEGMIEHLFYAGVINDTQMAECKARIIYTTDKENALKDATLIQESIPENYEAKLELIKEIEELCPENAIIATSTSSLLVADIAKDAKHPERIVGGHPFTPVYLIPLVEVVKGSNSAQEYVDKLLEIYKGIDKEPVILNKEVS